MDTTLIITIAVPIVYSVISGVFAFLVKGWLGELKSNTLEPVNQVRDSIEKLNTTLETIVTKVHEQDKQLAILLSSRDEQEINHLRIIVQSQGERLAVAESKLERQ